VDGIRYSASVQYLHQEIVLAVFNEELADLNGLLELEGPAYSVNDFIYVFDGVWGMTPRTRLMLVRWDQWRPLESDCPVVEAEATQTVERWRETQHPTTRLVEGIFEYNIVTTISLLMEIEVPEGRLVRTIVRIG
jgi:hypothetical protein